MQPTYRTENLNREAEKNTTERSKNAQHSKEHIACLTYTWDDSSIVLFITVTAAMLKLYTAVNFHNPHI